MSGVARPSDLVVHKLSMWDSGSPEAGFFDAKAPAGIRAVAACAVPGVSEVGWCLLEQSGLR